MPSHTVQQHGDHHDIPDDHNVSRYLHIPNNCIYHVANHDKTRSMVAK